jgi:hypothetical protein
VKVPTRIVPYVLLGTLTLGAALGAGLGLSQGPITHTGSAPVLVLCVSRSDSKRTVVTCTSPGVDFSFALTFFKKLTMPTELDACLSKSLAPYWPTSTVRYANGRIQVKNLSGSISKQQALIRAMRPIVKDCKKFAH